MTAESMVDLGNWKEIEKSKEFLEYMIVELIAYLAPFRVCFCLSLGPEFLLPHFDFNQTFLATLPTIS
jgi:hypothetical protein